MGRKYACSLTIEEVEEVFEYVDGELYRKERITRQGHKKPKELTPFKPKKDYCIIRLKDDRRIGYHQAIYILTNGNIENGKVIDHIDGDTTNNHPDNLICVYPVDNALNRQCHRDGKLPYVSYCKNKCKWISYLIVDRVRTHLGCFDTELEAFDAYIEANRALNRPVGRLLKLREEYIERNAA